MQREALCSSIPWVGLGCEGDMRARTPSLSCVGVGTQVLCEHEGCVVSQCTSVVLGCAHWVRFGLVGLVIGTFICCRLVLSAPACVIWITPLPAAVSFFSKLFVFSAY